MSAHVARAAAASGSAAEGERHVVAGTLAAEVAGRLVQDHLAKEWVLTVIREADQKNQCCRN
jgi:hypothetical protein